MTIQEQTEVRVIKSSDIFQYWEQLKESNILETHKIEDLSFQFGKVACGEWSALGFFEGQSLKGMVIFESLQIPVNGKMEWYAKTRQIYAPYNARRFLPMFEQYLKNCGYRKVGGATARDGKAMSRLFGFKVLYTYIEKEI